MDSTRVTCARVEEEDLDTRYLAGKLSDEDAEAFEEHYFACDRCWSAVQLGLDVHAASEGASEAPVAPPVLTISAGAPKRASVPSRRRWWPLAIAASIAIIAIGVWQGGELSNVGPTDDGLRGPADSIRAVASVRGRTLVVSWAPAPNADRYGVRLQKSDATLIIDRVVNDTSLSIPRDSLPGVADGERVYWEIRAFDALRRTIARSALVPTDVPPVRR